MKTCDLTILDVLLPDGKRTDLSLASGIVVHAGAGLRAKETIDAKGMLLLPGGTDMHVHMRDGNQSAKEDWESGSKSALAGGVTFVVDQPNTVPPLTTGDRVRERVKIAQSRSLCHFAINGGLDKGTDLMDLWRAGVMAFGEIFAAPSSFAEGVSMDGLSHGLSLIRDLGGLATIHAETVTGEHPKDLGMHDIYRDVDGEAEAVREIRRFNGPGCHLHFCHLSSAAAVMAARGQSNSEQIPPVRATGNPVSVEVTPHHLLLSYEDFSPDDTHARVNPPLRSKKVRSGLMSKWGMTDVVASDHAPHSLAEKDVPFDKAPSGIPGVETMIPLLLTLVKEKRITLKSLIDKTSTCPSRILGIPEAGIQDRQRVDFALYPADPVRVDPDRLHSRAGWTPFEGHPAIFPEIVVMNGEVVYKSGEFMPGSPRWFPGPGYRSSLQ